jgi:hypothetical protein
MTKRLICGYQFQLIVTIEPERDERRVVREFSPRSSDGHELSDSPFCRFRFPTDQRRAGVYAISVADRIVYVGKTINLSRRFGPGEYGEIAVPLPGNPQVTNRRVNHGILEAAKRGEAVQVWFHATSDRDAVEIAVIGRLDLPWNREAPQISATEASTSRPSGKTRWPSAMRGAEDAKATLLADRPRGEEMFAELMMAYPSDGWLYLKRAEAYEQRGEFRSAASDYARAEELLPFPGRKAQARAGSLRTRSRG